MCKCKSEEYLGNFGDCPQCRKPVQHKHAALIKAWADGAKIQCAYAMCRWYDTLNPTWDVHHNYRIKPEPKPDIVKPVYVAVRKNLLEFFPGLSDANIKLTFDGETFKLKSVCLL